MFFFSLLLIGAALFMAALGLLSLRVIYNWIVHQCLLNSAQKHRYSIRHLHQAENSKADDLFFDAVKYTCVDHEGDSFTAYSVNKAAKTIFPSYVPGIIVWYPHNGTVFISDFIPNDPSANRKFRQKELNLSYYCALFVVAVSPIATFAVASVIIGFARILLS